MRNAIIGVCVLAAITGGAVGLHRARERAAEEAAPAAGAPAEYQLGRDGLRLDAHEESGDHAAMHGHHATGRGHVDPGPRFLAAAVAVQERVDAEKVIGPERELSSYGDLIKTPEGGEALRLLEKWGGGTYYGNMEGHRRSVPYSIAAMEATFEHREEVQGMHAAMDHAEHQHCAQMVVNDRWERGEPDLTETLLWTLVLHVSYDPGKGEQRVDDVLAPSGWPAEVDQAAQQCYTSAFRGVAWAAKEQHPPSLYFDWPICINPPERAGAEPRSPQLN